jgi:hypothetical protein
MARTDSYDAWARKWFLHRLSETEKPSINARGKILFTKYLESLNNGMRWRR